MTHAHECTHTINDISVSVSLYNTKLSEDFIPKQWICLVIIQCVFMVKWNGKQGNFKDTPNAFTILCQLQLSGLPVGHTGLLKNPWLVSPNWVNKGVFSSPVWHKGNAVKSKLLRVVESPHRGETTKQSNEKQNVSWGRDREKTKGKEQSAFWSKKEIKRGTGKEERN